MSTYKILNLAGDGIGPEVTKEAIKVLKKIEDLSDARFEIEDAKLGGASIDEYGKPLTDETLQLAKDADSILLGAVGGPKWESLPYDVRPERALLAVRKELNLFANLRPAKVYKELAEASTLKKHVVENVDLLVVRELTGGIYFGSPRGVSEVDGEKVGVNTYTYSQSEIQRIAKVAFEASLKRKGNLCSVDKANVLETTELWRDEVNLMHKDFENVNLSHMYVDNASMQLVRNPSQFDVILTGNMFGDILSDIAAQLTGSIGMLPSASLNENSKGMYEPVHGSAPDITGLGKANPIATISSVAMMLTHSFGLKDEAQKIENAIQQVLKDGYRTQDILIEGTTLVSTKEMGDHIVARL